MDRVRFDVLLIRDFVALLLRGSTVADLDESLQLASIRALSRLWQHNRDVVTHAFVDDYNNLRFEIDPAHRSGKLAEQIIAWGVSYIRQRNRAIGENEHWTRPVVQMMPGRSRCSSKPD